MTTLYYPRNIRGGRRFNKRFSSAQIISLFGFCLIGLYCTRIHLSYPESDAASNSMIRSTTPQAQRNENSLRVITANINIHNYGIPTQIYNGDFDVLCLQEGPIDIKVLRDLFPNTNKYDIVQSPNAETSELYCIIDKTRWHRINDVEEVWTGHKIFQLRTAIIITLQHITTKKQIKVATLHLCGGKYDERSLTNVTLKGIEDVKNGLVNQMLRHDPDIIMGDFNSDTVSFMKKQGGLNYAHKNQLSFWQSIYDPDHDAGELSRNVQEIKTRLIKWNSAPFDRLHQQEFLLAGAENVIEMFEEDGTSIFGPSPDAIWYKEQSFRLGNFDRIRLTEGYPSRDKMVSDHDALTSTFYIPN